MATIIHKHKKYEVINPITKKTEIWSGDRITAFQKSYRNTTIVFPEKKEEEVAPPAPAPVKKKATSKTKK